MSFILFDVPISVFTGMTAEDSKAFDLLVVLFIKSEDIILSSLKNSYLSFSQEKLAANFKKTVIVSSFNGTFFLNLTFIVQE